MVGQNPAGLELSYMCDSGDAFFAPPVVYCFTAIFRSGQIRLVPEPKRFTVSSCDQALPLTDAPVRQYCAS